MVHGPARIVLAVFLPFACGGILSHVFRHVNAVIATDLVDDVGVNAAGLGLLTAVFLIASGASQVPIGVLLDRFGPRRTQASLFPVAALGAFVFAAGTGVGGLTAGRALIGIGVAGAMMAGFKAIVVWFPRERIPLINGCFMAAGSAGAMVATTPVEALLHSTDWRGIYGGLAVLALATAAAIFFLVPEKKAEGAPAGGFGEHIRGLSRVYRDRLFWRIAPLCAVSLATAMAVQGLWAGPWLRDVAGFGRADVANHLFVMALGIPTGFVLAGMAADFLDRRGVQLSTVIVCGLVCFQAVQIAMVLEMTSLSFLLWAAHGFFGHVASLVFALFSQHFPPAFAGRAHTTMNLMSFVGAFVAQVAIGAVIDLWPTDAEGGYATEAYRVAFATLLGFQFLGLLWFVYAGRRKGLNH